MNAPRAGGTRGFGLDPRAGIAMDEVLPPVSDSRVGHADWPRALAAGVSAQALQSTRIAQINVIILLAPTPQFPEHELIRCD